MRDHNKPFLYTNDEIVELARRQGRAAARGEDGDAVSAEFRREIERKRQFSELMRRRAEDVLRTGRKGFDIASPFASRKLRRWGETYPATRRLIK